MSEVDRHYVTLPGTSINSFVVRERDYEALAQQLAASQARASELEGDGSWGDMALTVKLNEAQATITRLEAQCTAFKGQRDSLANAMFESDKQLAEAVGLLRELESVDASEPYCPICFKFQDFGHDEDCKLSACLAKHEGKENG